MSRAIAERTGRINSRYRTRDGRYIIDNNDLKRLRLTAEEYITGLKGVERIDDTEAKRLIALGGRAMGAAPVGEASPAGMTEEALEGAAAPSEDAAEEAAIPSQQTEQEVEDTAPAEGEGLAEGDEAAPAEEDAPEENEDENENLEEEANDGNDQ